MEKRNKTVKPYQCFQSQGHVKKRKKEKKRLTVVAKFNAYYMLSFCRDNSTLNVFLCRPIVTLHQGQGDRNEYGHTHDMHKSIDRHAKFECHSLNIVRDITSIEQVSCDL